MNSTSSAVDYFLRVYGGFILFAGIPANIICIIVLATDTTNRITTRTFMVLLAVADCLVLITAVGRYWLTRVVGVHIRDYHPAICKIHHHLVAIFSDFAVGMLCSLAVERFLVVAFPHNASNVVTKKSILIGLTIFLILVISKNSLHFFIFDIIPKDNATVPTCHVIPSKKMAARVFAKVDFVTYSIIPYCVLFFCNVYLYLALRRQGRILNKCKKRYHAETVTNNSANDNEASGRKKAMLPTKSTGGPSVRKKRRPQSVIKVLVALSVLHFVTTLPGTTVTFMKVYDYIGSKGGSRLRVVQEGLLLLMFTNNAINFIAYFASSQSFRKRCVTIFCHRFGFFKLREETQERARVVAGQQTNGRHIANAAMVTML